MHFCIDGTRIAIGNGDSIVVATLSGSVLTDTTTYDYSSCALALKDTILYFCNEDRLMRLDLATQEVTTLHTGLDTPRALYVDEDTIYIAENGKIACFTDEYTPLFGSEQTHSDGDATHARMCVPEGFAKRDNKLYFVDSKASALRCIDVSTNTITTIVGKGPDVNGNREGPFWNARMHGCKGICAFDNCLYIADTLNNTIWKADFDIEILSVVIGSDASHATFGAKKETSEYPALIHPTTLAFIEANKMLVACNGQILLCDLKEKVITPFYGAGP